MTTSLVPQTVAFTGNNQITQGVTWRRTVLFASSMAAYFNSAAANHGCRANFIDAAAGGATVFSTALGNLTLAFLDVGTGDKNLEFRISAMASALITGGKSGTFQVEMVDAAGNVQRPVGGTWIMDTEIVTTST